MPSHYLHRKWQEIILGTVTEIDKIIDFPGQYFDVSDGEIKEAIKFFYDKLNIKEEIKEGTLNVYKKWLKEHNQWREVLPVFLYIILKKYG